MRFEDFEEILSSQHGWGSQEAAGHDLGSLGEQERWGGTADGQVLGRLSLAIAGCALTVVMGKGKAGDVFGRSSLKEKVQVSHGLPEEGERQEANCVICCALFGSSSHTALLVMVPVSFK